MDPFFYISSELVDPDLLPTTDASVLTFLGVNFSLLCLLKFKLVILQKITSIKFPIKFRPKFHPMHIIDELGLDESIVGKDIPFEVLAV
jgi:hypothetical protein